MGELIYDGLVKISTGRNRYENNWQNKEVKWSSFLKRLKTPRITSETIAEYNSSPKMKKSDIKDVGGYIGGFIDGGERKKSKTSIKRNLLALDLDYIPEGTNFIEYLQKHLSWAYVVHTTHSHTESHPKARLIIPLKQEVNVNTYQALARYVVNLLGIDWVDTTSYQPSRLMYWPSVAKDGEYLMDISDKPWLDIEDIVSNDWLSEWSALSSQETNKLALDIARQQNPLEKDGVVGAFCKAYSISEAISIFLPEIYTQEADNRYSYHLGSSVGGLIVYEDDLFAYSHHASDPISGKLCNSFDLVRIHLYGDLDTKIGQDDVAVTTLPSYLAMEKLALEDQAVKKMLISQMVENFDELEEVENDEWLQTLDLTKKGAIKVTISNIEKIILNDPDLKGRFFFDSFRSRPTVSADLPWQALCSRVTTDWNDSDDAGLRHLLERRYEIDHQQKIKDAFTLALLSLTRHPVKEWLEGLKWDGVERLDTLFIQHLDVHDEPYARVVTRKSLVGAVARIMEPGCKNDEMLVLVGPQGSGKSTLLSKLGGNWFTDSVYTVTGKEAYEQIQGYWIIEMAEMSAAKKAEIEQLKHFLTKRRDVYRTPYARHTSERPRQCVFFGTSNDAEFIKDATGGRRFWPLTVKAKNMKKVNALEAEYIEQCWAEAITYYRLGETWYIDDDEMDTRAKEVQAEYTESNSKQGLIENFLDSLVPKNWLDWSLEKRQEWYFTDSFIEKEEATEVRTVVCALEIWQELFKGDVKSFTKIQAREINDILRNLPNWESKSSIHCGVAYGRQRAFIKQVAK